MFGDATSTVAGRFRITGRCGVGSNTSITASQTCSTKGISVLEKVSGEYSKLHSVSGWAAASFTDQARGVRGQLDGAASSCRNTTRRNTGAVAL